MSHAVADWREDEARWVAQRSGYLERTYGLGEAHAEAVAWSELGYATPAIGRKIDRTAGTARRYLDTVADEFGAAAVFAKPASKIAADAPLGSDRDE